MATPRKLWETNVGLRPATHIMSTFVCLAIGQGLQVKANVANLFEMTVTALFDCPKLWILQKPSA
jgi:hypothetical protein